MPFVIGIIIIRGHGGKFLETLHQQPFAVHVGESQRPYHTVHSLGPGPLLGGAEECPGHFRIIGEVQESEPAVLGTVLFVGLTVDYRRYPAHGPAVAVSHEIGRLAEFKGGVGFRIQRPHVVKHERGNVIIVAFVKVDSEMDKFQQVASGCAYLFYF